MVDIQFTVGGGGGGGCACFFLAAFSLQRSERERQPFGNFLIGKFP